jgi:hypothetical protein
MALVADVEQSEADRAVRLVDVADRLRARMVLEDARAVGEAGVAAVTRAGVDLVEPDQRSMLSAGEQQEEDDEDDRDRLEQHALAHQLLGSHAGQILALGHADHALDEDEERGGRHHEDEDDQKLVHRASLGFCYRISSRQSAGAQ